nr:immunoglobulin heavy chain junction region [Macaca mulatta]MOW45851.1 immunoglobulin heavy chain junction region [Macaca mulatta]MOW46722.1 immunoglobulin heavy chain junction region [Macaca mulatta]MOW47562.1 immunoglobulin heavy chain junction region [Macaca mulatta]MOW48383.1 immunoglobulin heavy chain junction region [Macaca mulatta]
CTRDPGEGTNFGFHFDHW